MNDLKHIAIIMDGNGRWAVNRNLARTKGHLKGVDIVDEITKYVVGKAKYLSLYAFSTENWKRSASEVSFLMKILDKFLKEKLKVYQDNNIKFETIGDLSKFSKTLQNTIKITKQKTKNNTALTQILALNYGARDEIVRACNKIIQSDKKNIDEKYFESNLDTKEFPDVDILIRTGGNRRLSNFLLWQLSYAELFFSDTLWPDFNQIELENILNEFKKIKRNYGGIK